MTARWRSIRRGSPMVPSVAATPLARHGQCVSAAPARPYSVHNMYPTVSDVLALPVIPQGRAAGVAGAGGLERRVRWVHIAEIADIAPLLKGGELVLTTGIALPDDEDALARYVGELAAAGVVCVVVELVRHWSRELPAALVAAAEEHALPLVTLSRETRFVAVTEAVVGLIVEAQMAELRAAERIHETFTALTVAGAEPAEGLRGVAGASGLPGGRGRRGGGGGRRGRRACRWCGSPGATTCSPATRRAPTRASWWPTGRRAR